MTKCTTEKHIGMLLGHKSFLMPKLKCRDCGQVIVKTVIKTKKLIKPDNKEAGRVSVLVVSHGK